MNEKPSIEEAIDIKFQSTIFKEPVSGWLCVEMPKSGEIFGTRKPVKIAGTVDGHPFEATMMPLGNGNHMVPLRAALRKQINKELGEEVSIRLLRRANG